MRSRVSRPSQRWKLSDLAASKHHSTIQSKGNQAAKSTQKRALQQTRHYSNIQGMLQGTCPAAVVMLGTAHDMISY